MSELATGQKAPEFNLPTDEGGEISLSKLKGKIVVLYFYPKDDTPGCTTEAIDFSSRISDFEAAGAVVVGVSKDSVKKHQNFKAKHDLKVILASDPEGEMIERYGVWVEKAMYGRTYMGIERATFVIGPDGTIRDIWRKVKVKNHADEVLVAVQTLK